MNLNVQINSHSEFRAFPRGEFELSTGGWLERAEGLEMVRILRQFAQSANEGEIMKSFPLPSIQT